MTAARAWAVRDGHVTKMPVDGEVLASDSLERDEELLTGEAEPLIKQPGCGVLSGSFVVAGSGRIRATKVGGQAYAARLQAQARRFSLIRSELQQGTNQILRLVTWVMIPAGLLLIASEFFRCHDPRSPPGAASGLACHEHRRRGAAMPPGTGGDHRDAGKGLLAT